MTSAPVSGPTIEPVGSIIILSVPGLKVPRRAGTSSRGLERGNHESQPDIRDRFAGGVGAAGVRGGGARGVGAPVLCGGGRVVRAARDGGGAEVPVVTGGRPRRAVH